MWHFLGVIACGMHALIILHLLQKSIRDGKSKIFQRDSSIHILTESECLYCFSGLKQVSSNVDIACGMHVSIILHRVTNDSVSRKQTFNRRPSISGQIFKDLSRNDWPVIKNLFSRYRVISNTMQNDRYMHVTRDVNV